MPDPVRPAAGRGGTRPLAASLLVLLLAACAGTPPRPAAPPAAAAGARPVAAYPPARRGAERDEYHGVSVEDPYRWLESPDDPAVGAWIEAENALSGPYLEHLPTRAAWHERLAARWRYERWGGALAGSGGFVAPRLRGGRLFYLYNDGTQDHAVLMVAAADGSDARVLLDPNALAADRTLALADFAVAPDGRHLAYAVADGGSDWKTVRVRAVDSGSDLPEELGLVKFTPLAWTRDGRGFYYSRYPALADGRGDDTLQVSLWYHALGTPQSSDRFVYAISDHATRNPYPIVSDDGRWLVIEVRDGFTANGVYLLDLAQPDADARRVLDAWDGRYEYLGNRGREFYFRTTAGAPRGRIVALDPEQPAPAHWRTLVAEAAEPIDAAAYTGGHFVVSYLRDAHSVLRIFDGDDGRGEELELPGVGQLAGLAARADDEALYLAYTDFLTPHAIYRLDAPGHRLELFRRPGAALDPATYVTEQVWVASRDGTRLPMYLVHRRDVPRDGRRATLLTGYGGFGVPQLPAFSAPVAAWLEAGGVYALASLRGGGEYGEAWHAAGTRTRKQAVFDDFIAAAEWLAANKVTSRAHLGIRGRSNGGLLVAAALLQRPELFGAALPAVGVLDMLRYPTASANARQWSSDYGLADDPEEFRALLAYSPVHNVRTGVCLPPTLVTTAARDDRVAPWHSYKFAAALQAAEPSGCPSPLLLRVAGRSGHGADRPVWMQIDDYAAEWAFLAAHLGLPVSPP
ncbi:MAG: S9 family peptidase [Proteobacteria bacterium]|nr:S9 family peptidase [Pseudomonadota bacterium]